MSVPVHVGIVMLILTSPVVGLITSAVGAPLVLSTLVTLAPDSALGQPVPLARQMFCPPTVNLL